MAPDYTLMETGNAWTPARFWDCEVLHTFQCADRIKELKAEGWIGREASVMETQRGANRGRQCLGDISDYFRQNGGPL